MGVLENKITARFSQTYFECGVSQRAYTIYLQLNNRTMLERDKISFIAQFSQCQGSTYPAYTEFRTL